MTLKKRVAVIMGGWSSEREVSLSSGRAAATALREAGFDVVEIDATRALARQLVDASPDVVFNALHGPWGEDGSVQGLLEVMDLPYTHSGVLASALAMDKQRSKTVFAEAGVPAPQSVLAQRAQAVSVMEKPYVVKPNDEGSSVGVLIVREEDDDPSAALFADDWTHGETVMVERFVAGRELTVAVMGDRALCVTDIVSLGDFYDFHSKYADGGSQHILPAAIDPEVAEDAMRHALAAHEALGCRGLSRTDFRYDARLGREGLFCLEVNTQPGLTPTSLAPEQAAHCGISFPELCTWMVEDASCRR